MRYKSFQFWVGTLFQIEIGAVALLLLLASCGGGHSPNDVYPTNPAGAPVATTGPDSFLLFPNPQSSPAINSPTYALAYYNTIDPNNSKDTLSKWMTANGFGNPASGSEVSAVFGDVRDLGYGRYVHGRKNNDGTYAFMVENYMVGPAANYGYSSLNLDAAVAQDQRWHVNTNGIEVSPGPDCVTPLPNTSPSCQYFTKFYSFNPVTGARLLSANLDGRGDKAMPGICVNCHGGRGDALLLASASAVHGQFAIVGNPAVGVRGDLKAKLHFFEPDTFGFSSLAGFTRVAQEAAIKTMNKWVLCTYPLPTSASGVPVAFAEDACRPIAKANEWQGASADIIKAGYNNGQLPIAVSGVLVDGMPSATFVDTYVPNKWAAPGQSSLYQNVVKPTCRVCHLLRGVAPQSNIDFSSFAGFQGYADRIKGHTIDQGDMPLSKLLYDRYWATPSMYQSLGTFLQAANPVAASAVSYTVLDAAGNPLLKPGRPIADPGPDRVVAPTTGITPAAILSASSSLYADTYAWAIVSMPPLGDGALSLTTGLQTNFNATVAGTYQVQLTASKAANASTPVVLNIVVSNPWPATITPVSGLPAIPNPVPAAIRFIDIKTVLQRVNGASAAAACTKCHSTTPISPDMLPPVLYTNIDRNGDGVIDAADDVALYNEVRGRIDLADVKASPLLRHPAGYNHAGGVQDGFGLASSAVGGVGVTADQYAPGNPLRSAYDMFLNWILNGAPY
jgi:cytochrome c553